MELLIIKNKKMKKLLLVLCISLSVGLQAQKLSTRTGEVSFFSAAAVENIQAKNTAVSSLINLTDGEFAFLLAIKSFNFEKALMQEHFNENYMESDIYPKAIFKGSIVEFNQDNFTKDGSYELIMKGNMTIHGVSKDVSYPVNVNVKDGKVSLTANFKVKPADYKVEIPSSKKDNISDVLEITVKFDYD